MDVDTGEGSPTSADLDDAHVSVAHLDEAVRLAVENADRGADPFGAVVVLDGRVVATGVNTATRDHDATAHAEVEAVRAAMRSLGTLDLAGAVVVSSCEPCALCQVVCAVAGIERVVYAAPKELVPDLGGVPRPQLAALQSAVRSVGAVTVEHVDHPRAAAPFDRWVEQHPSGGER